MLTFDETIETIRTVAHGEMDHTLAVQFARIIAGRAHTERINDALAYARAVIDEAAIRRVMDVALRITLVDTKEGRVRVDLYQNNSDALFLSHVTSAKYLPLDIPEDQSGVVLYGTQPYRKTDALVRALPGLRDEQTRRDYLNARGLPLWAYSLAPERKRLTREQAAELRGLRDAAFERGKAERDEILFKYARDAFFAEMDRERTLPRTGRLPWI